MHFDWNGCHLFVTIFFFLYVFVFVFSVMLQDSDYFLNLLNNVDVRSMPERWISSAAPELQLVVCCRLDSLLLVTH